MHRLGHLAQGVRDEDPRRREVPGPGTLGQESANKELTAAITCMQEHGEYAKCESHFEGLKKLAGYEEPVKKSTTEKASEFAGKAGYKLLGVPVLFVAMKYIKIK